MSSSSGLEPLPNALFKMFVSHRLNAHSSKEIVEFDDIWTEDDPHITTNEIDVFFPAVLPVLLGCVTVLTVGFFILLIITCYWSKFGRKKSANEDSLYDRMGMIKKATDDMNRNAKDVNSFQFVFGPFEEKPVPGEVAAITLFNYEMITYFKSTTVLKTCLNSTKVDAKGDTITPGIVIAERFDNGETYRIRTEIRDGYPTLAQTTIHYLDGSGSSVAGVSNIANYFQCGLTQCGLTTTRRFVIICEMSDLKSVYTHLYRVYGSCCSRLIIDHTNNGFWVEIGTEINRIYIALHCFMGDDDFKQRHILQIINMCQLVEETTVFYVGRNPTEFYTFCMMYHLIAEATAHHRNDFGAKIGKPAKIISECIDFYWTANKVDYNSDQFLLENTANTLKYYFTTWYNHWQKTNEKFQRKRVLYK